MFVFRIHKSIDIDFAHHVTGHAGACINIHGHTWKFEVGLSAQELDPRTGFVIDFKELKERVLKPVHLLLDHSLALWDHTYEALRLQLISVGHILLCTRDGPPTTGTGYDFFPMEEKLNGARQMITGGIKVALFPFPPTSELIAQWLFGVATSVEDGRVKVDYAKVYETLHPVESVATYDRGWPPFAA
jgi:6-pyruvoyl tetrahydropterin synthase/QueD family protein